MDEMDAVALVLAGWGSAPQSLESRREDSAVVHVPTEHTESYSAESSRTEAGLDNDELRHWERVKGRALGEGEGFTIGGGTFFSAMGQGRAMDVRRFGDVDWGDFME